MSILSNMVDYEGWLRDESATFDRQANRTDLSRSARMYAHGVSQAYSQARRRIWQDVFSQPVPEDLIQDVIEP